LANATSRWCSQRCSILNGLFWTSIRWLHIIGVFSYDLGIYVFNYYSYPDVLYWAHTAVLVFYQTKYYMICSLGSYIIVQY
jgi:hypothetical protein